MAIRSATSTTTTSECVSVSASASTSTKYAMGVAIKGSNTWPKEKHTKLFKQTKRA